jgi:lipopolysaccharide transport system permease protein
MPELSTTLSEWWNGTRNIALWCTMAWYDIALRYRRSILGPLWLTASTGAMLIGMGPLYATLFGQPLSRFFPHLTLGIVFWNFFTSTINDGCLVFVSGAQYLKQPGFCPVTLVWRIIAKNILQLAHTILLYIPVMIWAGIRPNSVMLVFFIGFVVVIINLHAFALTLGVLTARFRDVGQIVASALTLLMFLTPVFWFPEDLPARSRFILYNPLAQMLEVLRSPLLGLGLEMQAGKLLIAFTLLNVLVAGLCYHYSRRHLVYWV